MVELLYSVVNAFTGPGGGGGNGAGVVFEDDMDAEARSLLDDKVCISTYVLQRVLRFVCWQAMVACNRKFES